MASRWRFMALAAGVVAVSLLTVSAPAYGQLFGQVSTARILQEGAQDAGGYFGVFEHATVFFGQYRNGLFSRADGGLQVGIVDPEGSGGAGLGIGGDLKFPIMSAGKKYPFDLALDPRLSYFHYSGVGVFGIGGSAVVSRDYEVSNGGYLTPYGAVNMRVETASAGGDDGSDTEFQISADAGLKWEVSDLVDIMGEVVLDDEMGVILGLNFKL